MYIRNILNSQAGLESVRLQLHNSEGNLVLYSFAHIILDPPTSTTYYIYVGTFDGTSSGDYEISIIENAIPEGTYDEIADYLTEGFWLSRGLGGHNAFDVAPGAYCGLSPGRNSLSSYRPTDKLRISLDQTQVI